MAKKLSRSAPPLATSNEATTFEGGTIRCGSKEPGLQPQARKHVRITTDISLDRDGVPVFVVSAPYPTPMNILKAAFREGLAALESNKRRHVRRFGVYRLVTIGC
jgi:hypothetical protein